jgi:hypothetical protein
MINSSHENINQNVPEKYADHTEKIFGAKSGHATEVD